MSQPIIAVIDFLSSFSPDVYIFDWDFDERKKAYTHKN